jgi:hypothetical protein
MTALVRSKTFVTAWLLGFSFGCASSGSNAAKSNGGAGASGGAGGSAALGGSAGTPPVGGAPAGSAGTGAPGAGGAPAGAGATSGSGGQATGGVAAASGASPSAGGAAGANAAGGAGSSAGGSAGATSGSLSLTITPNPNSVLSCYVSFTTDAPASSTVQFGVGGYQWEISEATPVTEHRVLVIGMRASQTYSIKASSGSASGEGTFKTEALPAAVPAGMVMINDQAKRAPGWTLMNVQQGGSDNRPRSAVPPMAVIYDEEGQPVWYYIDGPGPDIGGAVSTQLTSTGVVIGPTWNQQNTNGVPPREVDFGGNVIWECKHAACQPGKDVTHETRKLSNGHYVVLEYVTVGGAQNPVFRELDADSKEVWTLDWVSLLPAPSGSTGDWCHGNAIHIDIEKNSVYANCRWMGLMKTTYTNPAYQWLIPAEYGSKGQGDFSYVPPDAQFSDAHDPEYHEDDDTVLFYDNGGWVGSVDADTSSYHSRAVEYTIDATNKTATLSWEFPGAFQVPDAWYTTKWYSPFWGDVDRLDNGNILVAAGEIGAGKESRVFEVSKADGKLVWELRLPTNYGVYRADRVVPPLVHAITP